MLCCLAFQLQSIGIGVTTKCTESGSVPQELDDVILSDQYWYVLIWRDFCEAWHKGQERVLQWSLDHSAGNTFGCRVLKTGELHLYHNGRDLGVSLEGLPTDQPLWGVLNLYGGGWKVEANYIIPKGEAVMCGEVVCGVMFVNLNICTCYCHSLYLALSIFHTFTISISLSLLLLVD